MVPDEYKKYRRQQKLRYINEHFITSQQDFYSWVSEQDETFIAVIFISNFYLIPVWKISEWERRIKNIKWKLGVSQKHWNNKNVLY